MATPPAFSDPPDLGPAGLRSPAYLTWLRACVIGTGPAARVAVGVLAALGATVDQIADPAGFTGPACDVVICDRVEVRAPDDDYLGLVARQLGDGSGLVRHCWVTASAFGLTGPASSYLGTDLVCAAAGGLLAGVYDSQGGVYRIPGGQALQSAGYAAALAALHGVSLSRTRGTPVHLDLSAQDAVAFATNQQTPSHVLHKCGIPAGVAGRYSAPSGPFPAKDGWIQIIVVDNHQFTAFCNAMGRPDWIPIFPEVPDRVAGAEMIDEVVAEWSSTWAKDELEAYLQSRGVSATAVRPADEVAMSALFQSRGWAPPAPDEQPLAVPALITPAARGPGAAVAGLAAGARQPARA